MNRSLLTRLLASGLGLVVAALAWQYLAPPQLGGSTSYVIPYGISMKPKLNHDDLVLLRPQSSYKVGDVVLYTNTDLNRTVLHRIIKREGERFVFKGDNNDFIDANRPTANELSGKLWLRVPHAGLVLNWLRQPSHAAILTALVGLFAFGGSAPARARWRRRRHSDGEASGGSRPTPSPRGLTPGALRALLALAGVATVLGAIAAMAYTKPLVHSVDRQDAYTQKGLFDYSAQASSGPIYGADGRATSGDPLYVALVKAASFGFTYTFESDLRHAVGGSASLDAVLADPMSGWHHQVVLQAPTPFFGNRVDVKGTLALTELAALAKHLQELTGTHVDSLTLTLTPHIKLRGRLAGQPLTSTYEPALRFTLDQQRLALTSLATNADNTLDRSEPATAPVQEANTLSLGMLRLPVDRARVLAPAGAGAALLALLVLALLWLTRRSVDEPTRIRSRYADWLLSATELGETPERVIDLSSFEEIIRIAEHYERLVFHQEDGLQHTYSVEEAGVVYRFQATAVAGDEPGVGVGGGNAPERTRSGGTPSSPQVAAVVGVQLW